MKEKIHPQSKLTTFKCASCGAEYKIMSTCKADVVSVDVCANCHPVFVGKSIDSNVKGRAERLAKKFKKKNYQPKPKKVRAKKQNKTIISNLDDLAK
ncbi:MAG: 50S ribosomal protein L31 [Mycoplasmoidaceae bacterium]|nr:50S ribosomal protein L31 [Mycoplasmoidaceae bacterium]